jgi:hypothetical protein
MFIFNGHRHMNPWILNAIKVRPKGQALARVTHTHRLTDGFGGGGGRLKSVNPSNSADQFVSRLQYFLLSKSLRTWERGKKQTRKNGRWLMIMMIWQRPIVTVAWVCFVFGRSRVEVPAQKPAILTEIYHGFPQSFQTYAVIVRLY